MNTLRNTFICVTKNQNSLNLACHTLPDIYRTFLKQLLKVKILFEIYYVRFLGICHKITTFRFVLVLSLLTPEYTNVFMPILYFLN